MRTLLLSVLGGLTGLCCILVMAGIVYDNFPATLAGLVGVVIGVMTYSVLWASDLGSELETIAAKVAPIKTKIPPKHLAKKKRDHLKLIKGGKV